MNQLQIFRHAQFGEVEIIEIDGKQWFGATKTAIALKYVNPHDAISRHCRSDGVVKHEVIDSLGRTQEMNFINEGNLYRLITKSKLPDAEKFETWVFDDLIPTVRKTGSYSTTPQLPQSYKEALIALVGQVEKTELLEAKIEADRPMLVFAESLQVSTDSILIGQLAKLLKQNGIDIGQNRLFQVLRQDGYLMTRGDQYNMPTQRSMDMKLMEIKVGTRSSVSEGTKTTQTTKVTGKGIAYFINKFKDIAKTA